MGKMTINDLWSTTQKTKDLVTRTLLKPVMRLCAPEESSYYSTSDTRRGTLGSNQVIRHDWGKDRSYETVKLSKWWLQKTGNPLLNIVSIERYIYSIRMCCWNVAAYKWKIHNGKSLNHLFYLKVSFLTGINYAFRSGGQSVKQI